MRYLGIDYGTKKIGLALSDESGSMAFPHAVIPNDSALEKVVTELIAEKGVYAVVLGHSLSMQGEENPVMKEVRTFKDILEHGGIEVHLEPEFLTTVQAKRSTHDAMADASAAALILQTFLDKQ